jgi:hypothetical protein
MFVSSSFRIAHMRTMPQNNPESSIEPKPIRVARCVRTGLSIDYLFREQFSQP